MIIDFLLDDIRKAIAEIEGEVSGLTAESFASVDYVSSAKTIYFYNAADEEVGSIDTTDFVVDGMIDTVSISGNVLHFVFNTDAGKQPIDVDLSSVMPDLDEYWTSAETKNYVDSAVSAISLDKLVAVNGLPVSAETGTVMATKPSLGYWSESGLTKIYTITDLEGVNRDQEWHISNFMGYFTYEPTGYTNVEYRLFYQYDNPEFNGWRLVYYREKDGQADIAAWDLYPENGPIGLATVAANEEGTKYLNIIWNGHTSKISFYATDAQFGGNIIPLEMETFSPGTSLGLFQYDGTTWNEVGADVDLSAYWTSAETQNAISAATSGKADAANVQTYGDYRYFPKWNEQGIITDKIGSTVFEARFPINNEMPSITVLRAGWDRPLPHIYAPTTSGAAGDVLVSLGNGGAPVWSAMPAADVTKAYVDSADTALQEQIDTMDDVVSAAIIDLNDRKVESASVSTIWKGTQAEYDAATQSGATADPATLYIIVNNS